MDENETVPADSGPEAMFARLRKIAEDQHSELSIMLTVGGIRIDQLYKVRHLTDEPETLEGQLARMEELLADPRTAAASKAARLMVETEALGTVVVDLIKARTEEYRVALEAFRSISTDAPVSDERQKEVAAFVSIARDPSMLEVLIDIAERSLRDRDAKNAESQDEPSEGSET